MNPLEDCDYLSLELKQRVYVLLALCEDSLQENEDLTKEISAIDASDLRAEMVGKVNIK